MTPFILIAAAAQAASPTGTEAAEFKACMALVKSAPEKALDHAGAWRLKGGGLSARQCLGLAYAALERWASAATAFEQAAAEAETARDPRGGDFWAQAGNSWLAGGDPAKARKAFDAALAGTALSPALRGEAHLDRARAAVALGDIPSARADIQKGLELVAADPFAWYLSAALARREGDLPRARADIAKALELAADDADVQLEAGNIAGLSGDVAAARDHYTRALRTAPESAAGKAAAAALVANPAQAEISAKPAA